MERLFKVVSFTAKMCTVPLSLDAHRKEASGEKEILKENQRRDLSLTKENKNLPNNDGNKTFSLFGLNSVKPNKTCTCFQLKFP